MRKTPTGTSGIPRSSRYLTGTGKLFISRKDWARIRTRPSGRSNDHSQKRISMNLRDLSLVVVAGTLFTGAFARAEDAAPAALPGAPPTPAEAAANLAAAKAAPDVALTGDATKGEVIYKQYCLLCHG